MLSPGLALFLFGVSSIPETETVFATRVLAPAIVGVVLIVLFVLHALRTEHPLIDLRLFANRALTVSVLTTVLFMIAFMGAGLLFPSYFLQIRGETTLAAGLLLAPQGIGAMLTMPIAGTLADRVGPGKIVLFGMALIAAGMAVFTQVGVSTSYVVLLGALFVMGMGLGCTMMPIMTAALQTLTDHTVARGSTLMNIVQQTAGSIGTAVMSVVLTNQLAGVASATSPLDAMKVSADAFGTTFTVALVLILLTFVPAYFLPRKKIVPTDDADSPPTVLLH